MNSKKREHKKKGGSKSFGDKRRNEKDLAKNRGRKKPKQGTFVEGILQKTKKGFGFVIEKDSLDGDVFIPESKLKGAMNGDTVRAVLYLDKRIKSASREGFIDTIIERATQEIIGTLKKNKNHGIVSSDLRNMNEDIYVRKEAWNGAEDGDKVVVAITKYPDKTNGAEGKIVEIIGKAGEAGGDIKAIIRSYGLKQDFPQKAFLEAEAIDREVSEESIEGRRDLREETIITIDGEDSKDFDDAVSIKILENGNFLLGVHIADVTHYVRENDFLDKEAYKRGTSVYLLDQVIPMLPVSLSNGICSLNEGVDRLTLSVDIEVNHEGKAVNHQIYESVICSKGRLIYTQVSDLIEGTGAEIEEKYKKLEKEILLMEDLALILRKKREERGSIDFEIGEANIKLNEEGLPVDIVLAERRSGNKLIEEFMLLANEIVSEHYAKKDIPFIYRIHEKPDPEKMLEFKKFLGGLGLNLKGSTENVSPAALNQLLDKVKGSPKEGVVSTIMLRSMKKAFYGTQCEGHFGLAVKFYSHFTSPIRRYPDLMIHRIIKEELHGEIEGKRKEVLAGIAEDAARKSSEAERKAIELEREVEKLKKAEYMSYHVGESYLAVISGVTSFGFFAQLDNTVEGLVHINTLEDDHYNLDSENYRLIGERTNKIYSLGDEINVLVSNVNVESSQVDFTVSQGPSKKALTE